MNLKIVKQNKMFLNQIIDKNLEYVIFNEFNDFYIPREENIVILNFDKWKIKDVKTLINIDLKDKNIFLAYKKWNENLRLVEMKAEVLIFENKQDANDELLNLFRKKDPNLILEFLESFEIEQRNELLLNLSMELEYKYGEKILTYIKNNETLESIILSLMYFLNKD